MASNPYTHSKWTLFRNKLQGISKSKPSQFVHYLIRNHPCHCKRKCKRLTREREREFLYKIVDLLIGFIDKLSIVRCQPFYYSPCIWYSSVDWTSQKLHSISIAWSYYGNCTQLNWHFPIYHTYYSSKFLNWF